MQQVKLVNNRRDISVIHKGNRGLIRSLRIVRNAGQIKEIARDSLLCAQRDFLIAALTQFFDGLYANKLSLFQNGHPVTQFLDLTQHMGGKKHGSAPAVFLLQNIIESLLDQWV